MKLKPRMREMLLYIDQKTNVRTGLNRVTFDALKVQFGPQYAVTYRALRWRNLLWSDENSTWPTDYGRRVAKLLQNGGAQ